MALTSLALVAAGCTTGSLSAGTTQAGRTPAFQRVLEGVGADGTIDKTTALEAFALAFAPLPGVSTPSGPAEVIPSGSGPMRWVLSHFSELSPAQQRGVRAAIGHPSGKALAGLREPVLLAGTEQARFESLVDEARTYYAGRLPAGGLVVPQPEYFVTLNNQNLYDANAYTFAVDAQGSEVGPVAQCQIYFNPKVRQASAAAQREAAFHEVFHCYQARMVATLNLFDGQSANGKGPGSWLIEGGALWAGDEGAGAAPLAARWWKRYFATPTTPLFKRTYDATGFFSHLQEAGYDVYSAYPAAEQAIANGNVAAFNAFVAGGSDRFFPSWPTGLLREPSLGPEWDAHGPGITSDAVVPAGVAVGNGATPSGSVPAYANDDRKLTVSAEVVLVGTGRYSRLRAVSGGFDSMSPSDIYCTKGTGCQCPQSSPQDGTKFKQLSSGDYYLALSGGPSSNDWAIAAYSLADFCQQPRADSCLVGTWKLVSPPALPTTHVDFQKVDETATIAAGGTFILAVDVLGSEAAGDITVSVELKGTSTVQAVAIHGIVQPRSADFSGLQVTAQLGGTPILSSSLSQLFPGIDSELTPVAYRCGNGTLTLTSVSGQQWGFARA